MPLTPVTREKNWYSRGNFALPDYSTADLVRKSFAWSLKAALCDEITTGTTDSTRPASSIWHVYEGCNGVSYGFSDHWGSTWTPSNMVMHTGLGTAHSWCVLQNASGSMNMCIGLGGSGGAMHISFSRNLYTHATVEADRIKYNPDTTERFGWAGTYTNLYDDLLNLGVTTTTEHLCHFTVSDDGAFHFAVSLTAASSGRFHSYGFLQDAVDYESSDGHPHWCGWSATATGTNTNRGAPQWGGLVASGTGILSRSHTGGNGLTQGCTDWSWAGATTLNVALGGLPDTSWHAFPIVLNRWHNSVADQNIWRGRLQDIYYSPGLNTVGSSVPDATNPQFHVVGDILVPFGVIPTLAGGSKGDSTFAVPSFGPILAPVTVVETVVVEVPRMENSLKTHVLRSPGTDRYLLEVPTSALDLTDYGVGAAIGTVTTNVTAANASDEVLTLESTSELANFTLVSGVLVPSTAGLYSVAIDVQWDFDAGASIKRILTAWVNGADAGSLTFYGTVTTLQTDQFTTMLRLAAGDQVTIRCSQDGGGNTSEVTTANIRLAYVSP